MSKKYYPCQYGIIPAVYGGRITTPPLAGRKVQTAEDRGLDASREYVHENVRAWCPEGESSRERFLN